MIVTPTFTITRLRITLPIFSICFGLTLVNPNANIDKNSGFLFIFVSELPEIPIEVV